ncbi:probable indole-3-pyruvate monooxygenase YUCCA10 [Cornus florida]|uniref:probable indole-3-pyruvate monooxygenase YUCCA10 n=1 Tax=Cornus florida TaxID=4283 RepID=UPI002896E857|nr:probable indole-3-pyruvate monooxygenase YUCCA10 [Cornus florida]
MEEVMVVIVGAGPSGLATSACLSRLSIPNLVLEREDCSFSLWKKRSYDRLHLHLAKQFCSLPFFEHSPKSPVFMSKNAFIRYADDYVLRFNISPLYCHSVESADYEEGKNRWQIVVKNTISGEMKVYVSEFLVVACGENSAGYIPMLPGLENFSGEVVHSSEYKSGLRFQDKKVLVVGCGNSGMEIAYDLSNFGAHTSIVVRSKFHVLSKEMVLIGQLLFKYLSVSEIDNFITVLAEHKYGNLSKYGIHRPAEGPFYLKGTTGRSPVIDVGTVEKIRSRAIKVFPAISCIKEEFVVFENGDQQQIDAIVFATGYKSTAKNWLKDYGYVLNEGGMPKNHFPFHWKGENGIYCAGLSKMGLAGVSSDAIAIADDIKMAMSGKEGKRDG